MGATLTKSGIGDLVLPEMETGTLEGVTLGMDLTVLNQGNLFIEGGLLLNGGSRVRLMSTPNQTNLFVTGSQTLGGTGSVTFEGTGDNARIVQSGGTTLTIGPNVTIGGSASTRGGTVGTFANIINQGLIEAGTSGRTIFTSISSTLTNSGTLRAINGGILDLGGGDLPTNAGTITIGAGSTVDTSITALTNTGILEIAGTLNLGGQTLTNSNILRPGTSPGRTTITGDLVLDSNSIIDIEIEGTNPGPPEFDIIDVSGTVTLDGTLNVLLPGPFDPSPADTFQIMTCGVTCLGGVTMSFVTENAPAGKQMKVTYTAADVVVDEIAAIGTFTWTNGTANNLWNDAGNWDLGVPSAGDPAFVPIVAASPVFVSSGTQEVASLITNESITVDSGATFTVFGAATFNDSLVQSSATVNLNGASTITNNLDVDLGTLTVPGLTSVGGDVTIGSGGIIDIDGAATFGTLDFSVGSGTLTGTGDVDVLGAFDASFGGLFGTTVISTSGTVTLQSGGNINNTTIAGNFQLQNGELVNGEVLTWQGNPIGMSLGATFTNNDTFDIQTDREITGTAGETIANFGTFQKSVDIAGDPTVVSPVFNSSGGAVDVQDGVLHLSGGGTHDAGATFNVASEKTLRLNSGHTLDNTTDVTGDGDLELGGGGINSLGGSFNFSGALIVDGATNSITDTADVDSLTMSSDLTLLGASTIGDTLNIDGGTLDATALTSVGGTVSMTAGTLDIDTDITFDTFTMIGGSSTTLTGTANVDITNPITVQLGGLGGRANFTSTGKTTLLAGGTLEVTGIGVDTDVFLTTGELENRGNLVWTGDSIRMGGGATITNIAGATFDVQTDSNITGTAAETINNAGIFQKSVDVGGFSTDITAVFNNSGAGAGVDVTDGILVLGTGGTHDNNASFTATATNILVLGGGHTADATTSVSGAGNLDLGGGVNVLNGSFALTGDLSSSNGNNTILDSLAINNLDYSPASGANSLDLLGASTTVAGTLDVLLGTLTVPNLNSVGGAVTMAGGATLDIDTNVTFPSLTFNGGGGVITGTADVTVVGALTSSYGGLFGTTTFSTTGTTTLQSGGDINITAISSSGFQIITGDLVNEGLLTLAGVDITVSGNGTMTNAATGTIDFQDNTDINGCIHRNLHKLRHHHQERGQR